MKLRMLLLLTALFMLALPIQAQDVDVDSIVFSRDITFGDIASIQVDEIFPSSLTSVFAIIEGDGLETGEEVEIVWLFEGDELDTLVFENEDEDDFFRIWTSWSEPEGLEEGDWTVEVYYDGDLIAEEEFEVTDDPYVFPIRFAEDCGRQTGILINEGTEFEGIYYIYAFVEYANFDGDTVKTLWSIDGEIYDFDVEAEFDGNNWRCFFLSNGGDLMPDGEYGIIVVDEDDDELRESHIIEIEE